MTGTSRLEKSPAAGSFPMNPFHSHPDDVLWKFTIKDWFDEADPLSRDILKLLAADEDLLNIERFKEILEVDRLGEQADQITKIKRDRAQFFLLRLRLGFLHNVFEEVINNTYKNRKGKKRRPSLDELVKGMGQKVRTAYEELQNTMRASKRAMKAIDGFRNRASFHYEDGSFKKALALIGSETGEMIVNSTEKDLHSIVAYQVLDFIPSGRLSKDEVIEIKEEIELLQGKLHAFTFALFDEYFLARSLREKIISSEGPGAG
jgi:hypothetical protein